jgi:prevent-host-death family protein
MQHISARDAKNGFGRLIDLARAAPVAIEKHGRSVVVVIAVEEYERLSGRAKPRQTKSRLKKPEARKVQTTDQRASGKPTRRVA